MARYVTRTNMEQRKRYFNHSSRYELYNILFDNGRFMLVENCETKEISFGMCDCFNDPCGFPVAWSCLTRPQAVSTISGLIGIDKKYPEVQELEQQQFGYTSIDQWNGMIDAMLTV